MNGPNYRDFYQTALIPIGVTDQAALIDLHSPPLFSSHWLIALVAVPSAHLKEYYHWKVLLYPSNSNSSFQWDQPYYASPEMHSVHKALELARRLKTCCMSDELHTANLQEQIS